MNGFFTFVLDIALAGLLVVGIVYAVRLSRQIAGLRASREEMERFVLDFSTTVERAEAGVRGLRQAARTGGDDLEQLIEKGQSLRDELHFLVESADKIASRLGDTAGAAARTMAGDAEDAKNPGDFPKKAVAAISALSALKNENPADDAPSAAEKDLLQALKKLG